MEQRKPTFAASVGAGALVAWIGLSTVAGLSWPGCARAQMGTPPPAVRPSSPVQPVPPVQPAPPVQPIQVPPLQPVPPLAPAAGTRPAPVLPGQPPTQTGPVPPQQRGTPQITIPLVRPPPVPAVPAPPPVQRSANEPRDETLTRCNALAGAQAQTECRRRAGVQYRTP